MELDESTDILDELTDFWWVEGEIVVIFEEFWEDFQDFRNCENLTVNSKWSWMV
jgi:hypothetical protein